VLSRVADNLYWMRRYIERGDQIARVVGVNLDLAFDRAPADVARLWGRLLSAVWSAPPWAQLDRADGEAMMDLTSIDAVASCFAAARENARQVRQHISGDMWEHVNRVHLALNDPARRAAWAARPHGYFQTVREGAALFDAAVHSGLTREEGWHFLQLGLCLERAAGTARLLACQTRESRPAVRPFYALDEQLEWIVLLRACDALELYQRRCGTELRPDRIVHFLIADALSPRSIRYALDQIARALAGLAAAVPGAPAVAQTPDLIAAVESDSPDPLSVISRIEAECDRIHDAVYATYIHHLRPIAPVASRVAPWTTP
jgi:uncharacterized alpha-E superfamily protein